MVWIVEEATMFGLANYLILDTCAKSKDWFEMDLLNRMRVNARD